MSAVTFASAFEQIAGARHGDPFAVLGPHLEQRDDRVRFVLRTIQVDAEAVDVVRLAGDGQVSDTVPMERVHPCGLFEAQWEDDGERRRYRLRVRSREGDAREIDDPYRFAQVMGAVDLHLLGEGKHLRMWERLGAHPRTVEGVAGTYFAVWAPNAARVSVVGDWNGWDGRMHPMRMLYPNGIWEIFLPGVGRGARYKYEIRSSTDGSVFLKADPCAQYAELPPATASVVWDASYAWGDREWMSARVETGGGLDRPMSIYEVHLESWKHRADGQLLSYRELADELVHYVKAMGFTHIELMPVLEHPFSGSWGYQVTGFFAATSRFGPPEDLKYFIDRCHQQGIAVLLDWVPGHFPKDAHALARFDGTALYEHADPRQGEHRDWGTLIFNYGRNEVKNFLLASALFWLEEYHIDGLRVDAVASMLYLDYSRQPGEWVPNRFGGRENLDAAEFLREMNQLTHALHPGTVTIAEESTAWPGVSRPVYVGGLGFTYKWNMGWMHDILEYSKRDPVHRRWAHNLVTFSLLYAWNENFILPFSHDEVVHLKGSMISKMPGTDWQKAANLRALYGFMFAHPGKKLLFMGAELADWREWNEKTPLPWAYEEAFPHGGTRRFVRDLNAIYTSQPSLYEIDFEPTGFSWIDCNDNENSVVSFVRRNRAGDQSIVVVVNFTPVSRHGYRVGVPEAGTYRELLNSDADVYGGSNVGNAGFVSTQPQPAHGHPQSLQLVLPPLATLYFQRQA
ncbi:MAG: 1,4-alpha-glucan branching protein GlgB [Vicinamibacterales bacterium]